MFSSINNKKQKKQERTYAGLDLFRAIDIIFAGLMVYSFAVAAKTNHTTVLIAPKSGFYYFIYQHVGRYLAEVMLALSKQYSAPVAIIIISAVFEILITPLSFYSIIQNERKRKILAQISPQLAIVDKWEKTHDLDPDDVAFLKDFRKRILRANGVKNLTVITWTIIVLQILFFIPLYQGVAYSSLKHMSIYGINLANRNMGVLLLATAVTFLSNGAGIFAASKSNRQYYSLLTGPIVTFISGYFLPAIIPSYWIITSLFSIVRSLIIGIVIKPRVKPGPVVTMIDEESSKLLLPSQS